MSSQIALVLRRTPPESPPVLTNLGTTPVQNSQLCPSAFRLCVIPRAESYHAVVTRHLIAGR